MKFTLFLIAVLVAATATGVPDAAQAQDATVSVSCTRGYIGTLNAPNCSPQVAGSSSAGTYTPGRVVTTSGSHDSGAQIGSYAALSSARADFGTLGVSTAASANIATSPVGSYTYRRVEANAYAAWLDTLTVTSQTLALGTQVTVRLTQIIDVARIFSNRSDTTVIPSSQPASSLTYYGLGGLTACARTDVSGQSGGCPSSQSLLHVGSNVFTSDVVFRVGTVQSFSASLYGASTFYNPYEPQIPATASGETGIDALGTAHAYFTVLSSDAQVMARSGNSYALPLASGAPEPATWAMMLCGFGLVGGALRNRRSRRMSVKPQ